MNKLVSGADVLSAFGLQPGDTVLGIFAHPDDESVASGTTIHKLQENGVIVRTLHGTDGTASTLGDPVLVQGGWRRIEGMNAQLELGIPLDQQYYLGLQDGELNRTHNQLRLRQAIGSLATQFRVRAILTPGAEGFDGHSDHIAMHTAALDAASELPARLAVWGLSRSSGDVSVVSDPAVKLNAARKHGTQYPKLAARGPVRVPGSTLKSSERHTHLNGIDESLWPYYDMLFFSEHWIRYTNEKEDATHVPVQYAHA